MSQTVKIANVEFTNVPESDIAQYQHNVSANIPLPLTLDEELDSNFFTIFLSDDQKAAVRTAAPTEKRALLNHFISDFIG
jgi:hypothetical protein